MKKSIIQISKIVILCMFLYSCGNNNEKGKDGFTELFNGINLDGWVNHGSENWYVDNGVALCASDRLA